MSKKLSLALLTPVLILAHPFAAQAADDQAVKLDFSGHFKMYGNYSSLHEGTRATDILRDVDLTMSGETELSNGLTVGALVNADGDGADSFEVEDSFIFVSGNWGRFSLGMEDGAAFLLQVAAPSADENVDGMETFITPVGFESSSLSGTDFASEVDSFGLDYDNDLTAGIDKVTYLTPLMSGLQAGISYTPDVANFDPASRSLNGNNPDGALDEFGSAWEVGVRFENKISESLDYVVGAGYTKVGVEQTNASSTVDDFTEWNTALDVNWNNVGMGAVYTENNGGVVSGNDSKTVVLGLDYTVGPVRYGTSWLHNTHEETSTSEVETDRFAAGLVYEYGPGLTFRGSVAQINADAPASLGGGEEATTVTLGTEILF